MKSFTKACFGILGVGAVLLGVGIAMGGRPTRINEHVLPGLYNIGSKLDHVFSRAAGRWNLEWDHSWLDYDFDIDVDDYSHGYTSSETQQIPAVSADVQKDIREIDLELGEGEFIIRNADDYEDIEPFTIEGDYFRHYEAGVNGDKWEVELQGSTTRTKGAIVIYLPADVNWDKFDVDLGAGSLEIDSGVIADKFDLSVGMGAFSGFIDSPKIDVEVGMGSASVVIPASWEDCGYKAEAGMGDISANGRNLVAGVGSTSRAGSPMLDLEVGMGSIEIITEE